jgi:sulfur carrier protein
MQILLNGQAREFPEPQTVATLLLAAGYAERRVAVEVNLEIIAKSRHGLTALADGDRVEIIQAIGGG